LAHNNAAISSSRGRLIRFISATRDFAITKLALSGGLLIPPLIFYPLHPFHRVRDPSPVDFDLRQCLAGSSFLDLWW
ncbi:hypothetical protein T11_9555, partial [Trichinella zimbabwensis]